MGFKLSVEIWLNIIVILCCTAVVRCIPTRSAEDETLHDLPENLHLSHKDFLEQDHAYEQQTHHLNNTEFGKDLINFLLQMGEIEQMPNQGSQDDRNMRSNEKVTNDRYDELIAAFNVILEEILRQGKLSSGKNHHTAIDFNGQNYNQINQSRQMECSSLKPRTKSNYSGKTSFRYTRTDKSLNRMEYDLLKKIKILNKQLNGFMRNIENKIMGEQ